MVDLVSQYRRLQKEIDTAMETVIGSGRYINGPAVRDFENALAEFLNVKHVVGCANGTDALQIALMALELKPGDEVIIPAFTYVATAEVIALLRLKPVMVDVDPLTFNIDVEKLEKAITHKTKAIIPVHLFGQSADMDKIMQCAHQNNLFVIEDNAQSLGAEYRFSSGQHLKTGAIGHMGCTSFFPTKNLGCFGDGGAVMTNDSALAEKIRIIGNHGQSKKYFHEMIGCNSRLDTLQAAILLAKLPYLDSFNTERQRIAHAYNQAFERLKDVNIPFRANYSTHVFHQYTLRVHAHQRNSLQKHLSRHGVPSMIYYPLPLYCQKAYSTYYTDLPLDYTEKLCESVLSLPIHTEMDHETLEFIIHTVQSFFK